MAEPELPGMALLRVLEGQVTPRAADYEVITNAKVRAPE